MPPDAQPPPRREGGGRSDLLDGGIEIHDTTVVNGSDEVFLDNDVTVHAEVVEQLDIAGARALTERLRLWVQGAAEDLTNAYLGRVWVPLGYESFESWFDSEIGQRVVIGGRDERRQLVSSLRDAGMSIRAISTATSTSVGTVHADLNASRVQNLNTCDEDPGEHHDDGEHDRGEVHERGVDRRGGADTGSSKLDEAPTSNVVGIDGKRYPATKPASAAAKPRRRKPITDTAQRLAYDLETMNRRVAKFLADDRVRPQHKTLKPLLDPPASRLAYTLNNILDCILWADDDRYEDHLEREGEWYEQHHGRSAS